MGWRNQRHQKRDAVRGSWWQPLRSRATKFLPAFQTLASHADVLRGARKNVCVGGYPNACFLWTAVVSPESWFTRWHATLCKTVNILIRVWIPHVRPLSFYAWLIQFSHWMQTTSNTHGVNRLELGRTAVVQITTRWTKRTHTLAFHSRRSA